MILFYSFIHSVDLYSASSRDYYSEALPAQSRTKKNALTQCWAKSNCRCLTWQGNIPCYIEKGKRYSSVDAV